MTQQSVRMLQAAILLMIVALAASCATSNPYMSKLFGPRPLLQKDSMRLVRFLELDSINNQDAGWVSTDSLRKEKDPETNIPVVDDPVAKTAKPEAPLPITQGTRTKRTRE